MPFPMLVLLCFAAGAFAAGSAGEELRVSPRPAVLTQGFLAFLMFDLLVAVPIATYFFAFHGDWFVLYAFDARRLPSALAILSAFLVAGSGVGGFAMGSALVRAHRQGLAFLVGALAVAVAALLVMLAASRLGVVGTYAQFVGNFGLRPFMDGPLFQGALVMGPLFAAGALLLCLRIHAGARR